MEVFLIQMQDFTYIVLILYFSLVVYRLGPYNLLKIPWFVWRGVMPCSINKIISINSDIWINF